MKTDNAMHVGRHAFELAGLGLAPFRFVGASENVITYPDGTSKAGGTCDYCGTGIRTECHVRSRDGNQFKVGCDCIRKVGDEGLMKAYKSSPAYRAKQAELREARRKAVFAQVTGLLASGADKLRAMPHPRGFTDRQTGQPLTAYDQAKWLYEHSGSAGMASLLKWLNRILV